LNEFGGGYSQLAWTGGYDELRTTGAAGTARLPN
jgi:hypothetical protein